MTGTESFLAHVSEALETQPVSITVEARGLTFIDSSGLAALMGAREAADEAGAAFRVSEPSPALRRIVEITGGWSCSAASDYEPPGRICQRGVTHASTIG
jgi:anti-anti-sigma factor